MTLFTHLWLVLFVLFLGQSIYFRFLNFRTEVCMSWRTVILFFSYFFPEKIVKWSPHVLLIECSMFTPNQSINILLLNIAMCTKFIFLNRYILCNFEYQVDWFLKKNSLRRRGLFRQSIFALFLFFNHTGLVLQRHASTCSNYPGGEIVGSIILKP